MDQDKSFTFRQNYRLTGILLTASVLLLIPLIAMQFTNEVNWSLFDFTAAALLLFGTGLLCELILRKVRKVKFRVFLVASLLAALLLVWAELAVGVFGTPFAGY
jgi:peptidoglycan/LPS O-acetylase OafA/YrhL